MSTSFGPDYLLGRLQSLPPTPRLWIAYSGGLDSHVLLHAAAAVRQRLGEASLQAVHVNHALHPDAGAWARHCQAACQDLAVPCTSMEVDAEPGPGQSPEAAARHARYAAIASLLEPGELVLLAHHRDDQAETLLLNLLRGSGPHGLAAMPALRRVGGGWLARPLLGLPRAALRAYAERHDLRWVEDPSNEQDRFQRNYLRNEVMPALRLRWPGLADLLGRAAAHQREAAELLDDLGARDLRAAQGQEPQVLRVAALEALEPRRQRNLLRFWLRSLDLPVPGSRRLQRIVEDVIRAAPDAEPLVRWPGAEIRRYRDALYAMAPLAPVPPEGVLRWRPDGVLELPQGRLSAEPALGRGLALPGEQALQVRLRRGGERCRLPGRRHTQALKKLLQERGIPPWQRQRLPLIYLGESLAAVADLWLCEPYAAGPGQPGWVIRWEPAGP